MSEDRVQWLVEKIRKVSQAYYDGNPIISDEAFDRFVEELKALDPDNDILHQTGYGYIPSGHLEKVKHIMHVGSLDKIKHGEITESSLRDFVITPKVDGGSSVAYYDNGHLVRILSRGDGDVGLDITRNMLPGKSVPVRIADPNIIAVRGEVAMTWQSFSQIGGAHPRNRAVGISQSIHLSDAEIAAIKFVTYSIIQRKGEPKSKLDDLETLKRLGFIVVPHRLMDTWKEFQDAIEGGLDHLNQDFRYLDILQGHLPVDGLVITHNLNPTITEHGDTYLVEYQARAYKFKGEEADTEVIDIAWNMSRTGRLVPVLLIDPVEVSGAVITRVTANNAEWLKEMECGVGAKIRIVRSGEVIPYVTEVVEPKAPSIPKVCPACQAPLTSSDRDLMCDNPDCPKKVIVPLYRIFELVKVDGIGDTIIKEVIRQFRIYDFKVFRQWVDSVDPDYVYIYGQSTSEKFAQMVRELKTLKVSVDDVLWVANIPRMGKSGIKALGRSITLDDFLKVVNDVEGVPPIKWSSHLPTYPAYENLVSNFWRVRQVVQFFGVGNIYMKVRKNIKLHVAITGSLSKPRADIEAELSELGITVGSISKSTDYLICNQASLSSKASKAKQLGIPIVSEAEFKGIIGGI